MSGIDALRQIGLVLVCSDLTVVGILVLDEVVLPDDEWLPLPDLRDLSLLLSLASPHCLIGILSGGLLDFEKLVGVDDSLLPCGR